MTHATPSSAPHDPSLPPTAADRARFKQLAQNACASFTAFAMHNTSVDATRRTYSTDGVGDFWIVFARELVYLEATKELTEQSMSVEEAAELRSWAGWLANNLAASHRAFTRNAKSVDSIRKKEIEGSQDNDAFWLHMAATLRLMLTSTMP